MPFSEERRWHLGHAWIGKRSCEDVGGGKSLRETERGRRRRQTCWLLDPDLPASRPARKSFCRLSPATCGILLRQPLQRNACGFTWEATGNYRKLHTAYIKTLYDYCILLYITCTFCPHFSGKIRMCIIWVMPEIPCIYSFVIICSIKFLVP